MWTDEKWDNCERCVISRRIVCNFLTLVGKRCRGYQYVHKGS